MYAALGILIAMIAWYMLSSKPSSSTLLSSNETAEAGATEKGLVEVLLQLRAVTLSGTILSDPAFLSLRDFGTQIVPEPIGRPNPFAPF